MLGDNVFQIQTRQLQPDRVKDARAALSDAYRIAPDGFDSTSVGPTFGQQVANSAVQALILSILVIGAYIAFRFQPKFAIPVLIALLHDILITAGIYSLTGREVTTGTVAAFLTILGYSLYDTIIVFDRIRENLPRMPRAAFSQIVNRSMSEVLTRSLVTSVSTLFGVVSLLIFGGVILQDFAFAMLVGIASGTYSSIFIASPVLTAWKEREPAYRRRRERIAQIEGSVPAFADDIEVAKLGSDDETDEEIEAAIAEKQRRGDGVGAAGGAETEPEEAAGAGAVAPAAAGGRRRRRRGRGRRSARGRRPARARPRGPRGGSAASNDAAGAASTGGIADDGNPGLVHDGNRALALHRVHARPLLAGDHRRLRGRRRRVRRLRRGRPPGQRQGPG